MIDPSPDELSVSMITESCVMSRLSLDQNCNMAQQSFLWHSSALGHCKRFILDACITYLLRRVENALCDG